MSEKRIGSFLKEAAHQWATRRIEDDKRKVETQVDIAIRTLQEYSLEGIRPQISRLNREIVNSYHDYHSNLKFEEYVLARYQEIGEGLILERDSDREIILNEIVENFGFRDKDQLVKAVDTLRRKMFADLAQW